MCYAIYIFRGKGLLVHTRVASELTSTALSSLTIELALIRSIWAVIRSVTYPVVGDTFPTWAAVLVFGAYITLAVSLILGKKKKQT